MPLGFQAGNDPKGEYDQIVRLLFHPAIFFQDFNADDRILLGVFGDFRHLGLDELDAHCLGVLVKLLKAFAECPDVHVVDRHIDQRQGAGSGAWPV